jgi:hypothetical protein
MPTVAVEPDGTWPEVIQKEHAGFFWRAEAKLTVQSRGNAPTLVSCGAASLVDGATDDHGVISLPTGGTASSRRRWCWSRS